MVTRRDQPRCGNIAGDRRANILAEQRSAVDSFAPSALALVALIALFYLAGCKPAPPPSSRTQSSSQPSPAYPTRPNIAPPTFKVFHQDAATFTLVVPDNASDEQIVALIYELRDAAHAHHFAALKLDQKAIDARGLDVRGLDARDPSARFHIYRGTKCATEKYAAGEPPCGGSYHAAGDYTFGTFNNAAWDDGLLLDPQPGTTDLKETPLWNSDAPYTAH